MTSPLPNFPTIALADIKPASAILFYGGTKITEWVGNHIYKHPYHPPAFHAAFYIGGPSSLFLNVGAFRVIKELPEEFKSTRRVDVIEYPAITELQRAMLADKAIQHTSQPRIGLELPDYGVWDFFRFGMKLVFKNVKPSRKEICSEDVALLFASEGVETSAHKPEDTAPWDLLEYALANPSTCQVRTLFIGADFKP